MLMTITKFRSDNTKKDLISTIIIGLAHSTRANFLAQIREFGHNFGSIQHFYILFFLFCHPRDTCGSFLKKFGTIRAQKSVKIRAKITYI